MDTPDSVQAQMRDLREWVDTIFAIVGDWSNPPSSITLELAEALDAYQVLELKAQEFSQGGGL